MNYATPCLEQVHTSDPELFEDHFNHSYACGSLDGNDAHACWPLYNVDYYPRWASLDDGVHTVEVVVTHPNSAEEIEVIRAPQHSIMLYLTAPLDITHTDSYQTSPHLA